ncbi:antibiotic biosynthesis monooxygenase [Pseudonocardia sichuanensis]|uniref:antibiotic biosynthesis monooxygenase n=1 Tax=Pseudonocardia kunmingensis TaxID=630975 RepID=UPI00147838D2|nr:antibiotic biosynthesis monooxygenase [Pseudonocardia kunmingensis]
MYARSTTIRANPESIETGIAHVRDEVMPMVLGMEGCTGISMLVDRMSGQCIVTTAWQSKEAMEAGADRVRPLRERAAEMLGGRPQVDQWEIAVMHRDHTSAPGACVRATWLRMQPDQADRAIDVYRMGILPAVQEFEGFCSASLMVDRTEGYAVSSVTFDSREAMERSREPAEELRARGIREAGVEFVEGGEFELALAHLRVPEMA